MFSFDPNLPSSKRVSSRSRRIYPSLLAFLITRISNQNINALRLEITLIYHCFPNQFKQIAFPHSDVMHKNANKQYNFVILFVICFKFQRKMLSLIFFWLMNPKVGHARFFWLENFWKSGTRVHSKKCLTPITYTATSFAITITCTTTSLLPANSNDATFQPPLFDFSLLG